jgi:hypothetical protein
MDVQRNSVWCCGDSWCGSWQGEVANSSANCSKPSHFLNNCNNCLSIPATVVLSRRAVCSMEYAGSFCRKLPFRFEHKVLWPPPPVAYGRTHPSEDQNILVLAWLISQRMMTWHLRGHEWVHLPVLWVVETRLNNFHSQDTALRSMTWFPISMNITNLTVRGFNSCTQTADEWRNGSERTAYCFISCPQWSRETMDHHTRTVAEHVSGNIVFHIKHEI